MITQLSNGRYILAWPMTYGFYAPMPPADRKATGANGYYAGSPDKLPVPSYGRRSSAVRAARRFMLRNP